MNNLVTISLMQRQPGESPFWFLVAMLVLIGVVFWMDHRKEKKDGKK